MKRKLLSLVCACSLALGLAAPVLAADFSDVKTDSWYYQDVQAVVEKGLMQGVSSTVFQPDAYVTRATVLTVLWRLEGSPEAETPSFTDVPADSWYAQAAGWAQAAGIAAGYNSSTLGAGDTITREQLALFLYRYAQYKGDTIASGVLDLYPDGDRVSPWALDGMKHALGAGLITGTNQNTLSPLGWATRAQLAVILERLMTPVKG